MTRYGAMIVPAAALLALAGCGRSGEAPRDNVSANVATDIAATNDTAPAAAADASGAQSFANVAAASDAFEIETSRLALTNGASAAVKAYARKMIDAHTASTAKLKTAAASATPAVTPNPALNAEQQQKLDQLKTLNGAAFDRAYASEQAAAHQQTLDALRAYSATGEAAPLKAFATELVPIVTAHLNMAKGLKP